MLHLSSRLVEFLDQQQVDYEVIHHLRDFTAQRTAADTHTPGRAFAKAVIVIADGARPAMLVLPAHQKVDLKRAASVLGAAEVTLADERQLRRWFPDCEVGAEPPFGNLYDVPVYVSPMLAADEEITFNGGSHDEAVRLPYRIYQHLVHPKIADVAMHS
ncbi:MAG: YbaK/EbsC family protein [Phycisphaeraceae bacterium]